MGNVTAPEVLTRRWAEILADPLLRDLPYKIELNAWGKIEMSPASNVHGRLQFWIGAELQRLLPDGGVVTEASVLTEIGIRVPDVVWASQAFLGAHGRETPFPRAPEICVEVLSPSNTEDEISGKIRAYLAAGAEEVWTVAEDGAIRFFGADGERARSSFGVAPAPPPAVGQQ
jgi:Uma2 family endonuclease